MIHKSLCLGLLIGSLVGCSTVYDNSVGLVTGLFDSDDGLETSTIHDQTEQDTVVGDTSKRLLEESNNTTSVAIESAPIKKTSDEVEILWKIPKEKVDGFVLHYGYQKEELTEQISINLSEIEKYDDPEFGFVYRYVLKNVPASKRIFVKLAAQLEGELTPFSEVFEVAAE